MADTDEYLDCVNNWWSGFVGKQTCEAGYLVCKGKECDRYAPEKKQKLDERGQENMTKREVAIRLVDMISDLRACGNDEASYHEAVAIACAELMGGANDDVGHCVFEGNCYLRNEIESDG